MTMGMPKLGIVCIALATSLYCVGETTNYVFSADGKLASTSPRSLPQVGRDYTTGAAITNLAQQPPEVLIKCGWYRVEKESIELGPLQYEEITGYVFNSTLGTAKAIVEVKNGAPLKKYTQYKIIGLLMSQGKWEEVKSYLEANKLYDLFMGAQYLTNADPYFFQAKKVIAKLIKIDSATLEVLLDQCIDDE